MSLYWNFLVKFHFFLILTCLSFPAAERLANDKSSWKSIVHNAWWLCCWEVICITLTMTNLADKTISRCSSSYNICFYDGAVGGSGLSVKWVCERRLLHQVVLLGKEHAQGHSSCAAWSESELDENDRHWNASFNRGLYIIVLPVPCRLRFPNFLLVYFSLIFFHSGVR